MKPEGVHTLPATRNLIIAFVALTLSGCSLFDPFGDGGSLQLKTDGKSYEPGSPITVTAKNNSSADVYYSTCMAATLEELSEGKVVDQAELGGCDCVCAAKLAPGDSWDYHVDVAWLWQNLGVSQPKIGPDYRFQLRFFRDKEMTHPLSSSDLTTNVFRFVPHTR